METLCRLSYRGNERDPMRTGITVAIRPQVSSLTVPPPRRTALIILPSQATTRRSWWRVRDSNPRSIPRLIYSQLPLAARATRRAPRPSRSVLGSGAARCRGRIASSRRSAPIPAVGAWSHDRTVTRSHSRRRRGGAALRNVPEHPRASAQRSQRLTAAHSALDAPEAPTPTPPLPRESSERISGGARLGEPEDLRRTRTCSRAADVPTGRPAPWSTGAATRDNRDN